MTYLNHNAKKKKKYCPYETNNTVSTAINEKKMTSVEETIYLRALSQ